MQKQFLDSSELVVEDEKIEIKVEKLSILVEILKNLFSSFFSVTY